LVARDAVEDGKPSKSQREIEVSSGDLVQMRQPGRGRGVVPSARDDDPGAAVGEQIPLVVRPSVLEQAGRAHDLARVDPHSPRTPDADDATHLSVPISNVAMSR
jgi:hypothetical protein